MADDIFESLRLAAVYDAFDAPRDDLDAYLGIVAELGARSVLDLGCGTGCLAVLLAAGGVRVTGVDPAEASLDVARRKPWADHVTWLHGDATDLPPLTGFDLVTMTGNAAQAVVEPADWDATLAFARAALVDGGHLVLETRDRAARVWQGWTPALTRRRLDLPAAGVVEQWTELLDVALPLVTFRTSWHFAADDARPVSTSTLRFRGLDELTDDLSRNGFEVHDIREAPDRPGLEHVVLARAVTP